MRKIFTLTLLAMNTLAFAQAPVKKVILEDFTGTWCGWCPEGTVIIDNLLAANPSTFIPVASHNGDALQIPDGAAIDAGLNVTAYPNGAVDRYLFSGEPKIPTSRGKWSANFNTRKNTPAIVSVSIVNPKVSSGTYSATVKVKFVTAPTSGVPLKMNVYLTEDSIAAIGTYEQSNYSNNIQGGASPLTNWFHNATLRKALGGAWGFSTTIPATPVVGTEYSENISFTLGSAWVAKHINVIAFVAYDGTAASNQKEILNAEQLPLKYWYPTGMQDVNILDIVSYPNPAAMHQIVKTSFSLKKDGTVSLQIIDMMGRIISDDYKSFEISGAHTIQWSPAQKGITTSGMYFVKISTDQGESKTRAIQIN